METEEKTQAANSGAAFEDEAYLWVKISPLKGEQANGGVKGQGAVEGTVDDVFTRAMPDLAYVNAHKPCLPTECGKAVRLGEVAIRSGGRPPVMSGKTAKGSAISWMPDRDFNGTRGSGTAVDMHAVEGGRGAALKWLAGADGQAWCRGAITYFLVVLRPEVTCTISNPASDPEWQDLEDCLKERVKKVVSAVDPLWLNLPQALPAGACQDLKNKEPLRHIPAVADAVQAQDRWEQDALWPVQCVVGNPDQPPKVVTKLMVGLLMDCMRLASFHFKRRYREQRPRPYDTAGGCSGLTVMPDVTTPWHPTYPGGHAAMAYALAAVYARMFPTLKPNLDAAAASVAQNREIAGLHYEDDSTAGAKLAQVVVNELLKVKGFQDLVEAAQSEW